MATVGLVSRSSTLSRGIAQTGAQLKSVPLSNGAPCTPFLPSSRSLCKVPTAGKAARAGVTMAVAEAEPETERFRLNNLKPQPGSRKRKTRKGRGIAAGQGASCGFGMRGQKSRSGSGTRPGFEGGQMPLYRRLPKLRGIAGGMPKGRTTHVAVNLEDIVARGLAVNGGQISRESLIANGLIKPSGKERKLPLKVLGDGDLTESFTIEAGSFSKTAKAKLEAAGCNVVQLPGKVKWTKKAYFKKLRYEEMLKNKAKAKDA
eukprot:TRINITY_DN14866_c0_g1_i1.p1 TRINITY_DN14866_c0_g1~~TRINITY_DN14866_c0_g1_i1.p1  ORF type:complete len:260 (-),score=48.17 TRINITY_DN14866_c0_g1_i1:215-994(-)